MNKFYVYAYLDPRKQGKYVYGCYSFDYEPFYVGKGSGNRLYKHLMKGGKKSYNPHKDNKIKKIIKEGQHPIIIKVRDGLSENNSFELEIELIKLIGRKNEKGPLTNIYDGGEGSSKSIETRKKISKTKKKQYASGEVIHPLLGTKWSEETRCKIMKSRLINPYRWTKKQKRKLTKIRCLSKNQSQTEKWNVIDPMGRETVVYGLGEFCRNNNLDQPHMWEVSNGKRKHHKGWKCQKLI